MLIQRTNIILLSVIVLVITSCNSEPEPSAKVGLVFQNQGMWQAGAEIGISQFRADHPELDVEFVYEINSGDLAASTKDLIDEHPDLSGLVVGNLATTLLSTIEVVDEAQIPMVSPLGYSTEDLAEIADVSPNTFMIINEQSYFKAIADLISNTIPDVKKVAVIYTNLFGDWADSVEELLKNAEDRVPVEVVGKLEFVTPADTCAQNGFCTINTDVACDTTEVCQNYDFGKQLEEVFGDAEPDVLFVASYGETYLSTFRFIKANKDKLSSVKAIVAGYNTDQILDSLEELGMANGLIATTMWEPGQVPERVKDIEQRMVDDFQAMFNTVPTGSNIMAYTAASVLCDAVARMLKKGESSPEELNEELRETDHLGPLGLTEFDEDGLSEFFVSRMYQYDSATKKKIIVYPSDVATADVEYPLVPWSP